MGVPIPLTTVNPQQLGHLSWCPAEKVTLHPIPLLYAYSS